MSCIFSVILNASNEEKGTLFILYLIFESCRKDSTLWDQFVPGLEQRLPLFGVLLSRDMSQARFDATSKFIGGLLGHSGSALRTDQMIPVFNIILEKSSSIARLDCICSILKNSIFRPLVWGLAKVKIAINSGLQSRESEAENYKAVFAIWILSFDAELLVSAASDLNLARALPELFKDCRVEKVIRVLLAVTRNALDFDHLRSDLVESSLSQNLDSIEQEKWKDLDIYQEIKELQMKVSDATAKHTNISRYERELETGKLTWNYVHSEKFWTENAKLFEQRDFVLIRQLTKLVMQATDVTTLAVACFDIGEFSRVYPLGKAILNKMNCKPAIMALMSHENREVAREALLCTQKLMLNNWQQVI